VKDLSAADTVAQLAGFDINPLPIIMGITMVAQMKLTPQPATVDKMQQRIFMFMPLIFLFSYNFAVRAGALLVHAEHLQHRPDVDHEALHAGAEAGKGEAPRQQPRKPLLQSRCAIDKKKPVLQAAEARGLDLNDEKRKVPNGRLTAGRRSRTASSDSHSGSAVTVRDFEAPRTIAAVNREQRTANRSNFVMNASAIEHARHILDTMLGYLGFRGPDRGGQWPGWPHAPGAHRRFSDALIGRRGETLDDIQYLVNRDPLQRHMQGRTTHPRGRGVLSFHAGGQDGRPCQGARRERVRATGQSADLPPMNSYYRRLIHNVFVDDPEVMSVSQDGAARFKRITLHAAPEQVSPRRPKAQENQVRSLLAERF
jgi:spoIIIJ-associated protein